jgi:MFS family permease
VPLYSERLAFQQDLAGHWRNAYPMPPVLEGAALAALLRRIGALSLAAPLAPAIVSKTAASFFASLAAALAFVIARRFCGTALAGIVAVGFALGTGVWPVVSQALWQHASVIWSTMAAIALWAWRPPRASVVRSIATGALLGWALSARPQVGPLIVVLAIGINVRTSMRERVACAIALAIPLAVFAWLNLQWFGHPLGMMAQFERVSRDIHRQSSTWQWPGPGALALLFSPSRGLLVFSPVVLVVCAARMAGPHRMLLIWTLLAAAIQFVVYASFTVWWGGHTYGPRYLLDLLPALVPAAAAGAARIASSRAYLRVAASAALAWSLTVSATGAFCYPHDEWNTDPMSVDQYHDRVWQVRDSQIERCWRRGLSPQNFAFFDPYALARAALAVRATSPAGRAQP